MTPFCFVILALLLSVEGYMLTTDPTNPCKATANGTFFDISGVLQYPAQASDPGFDRYPPRVYNYWYSPCEDYKFTCPDAIPNNVDNAVCQKADRYYNCGTRSNAVWLWNGVYETSKEATSRFTILYPGGWSQSWRSSNITFIQDKTLTKPQFIFISEDPYLQYNFIVRAPCIGEYGCKNTFNYRLKVET
eukprot:UN12004